MLSTTNLQLLLITLAITLIQAKVYSHCELARELLEEFGIPRQQLATWVCIAEHEANMNTSAMNPGSGDHGLFQISELFWCSPPGYACGVSCTDLRNDDIEDDVICARRIYREHKRLSGDGFNAWVVYKLYCNGNVSRYIEGCLDGNASKIGEEALVTAERAPQSSLTNLIDISNVEVKFSSAPFTSSTTPSTKVTKGNDSVKSTTDRLKTLITIKQVETTIKKVSALTSTERVTEKEAIIEGSHSKLAT